MSVSFYLNEKGIRHITITGQLEKRLEAQEVLEYINKHIGDELHITFLDASIIDYTIVEKLAELKKYGNLKVFVLKPYLYSYLYSLGVSSKYITGKYIFEKDTLNKNTKRLREINNEDINVLLSEIYKQYGYDFSQYQNKSIIRRIKACMARENINTFDEFKDAILYDAEMFEQLFLDFSINTTEFFRNPEVFTEMREEILPYLNKLSHIRIWCAGCSTGQEPYSLAILLEELGMLYKTHIYATDINPYVIEEAQNGLYSINGIENNIRNYREAKGKKSFMDYFHLNEGYIRVDNRLKERILFFQHSLVESSTLKEIHLILCRNVFIYFNSDLQSKILGKFYQSLYPHGFLILGQSEGILHNDGQKSFYNYHQDRKIFRARAL